MNVKKLKRKCSVRGCKNIETYAISKTREMGNSVIICKECLKSGYEATEKHIEPIKVKQVETKPLFPHPEEVTVPSVADKEPELVEVIEEVTEDTNISVAEDTVTKAEETPTKPTTSKKKSTKR